MCRIFNRLRLSWRICPAAPATVYAGTSDYGVLKSVDGGLQWNAANKGLPSSISVRTIAIDPVNRSTMYAGSSYSGIFKTVDWGNAWVSVDKGGYFLEIDPFAPATVYAAGGRSLFKTTDGGQSWINIAPDSGIFGVVNTLAIDPVMPAVLYAGTRTESSDLTAGLFKSADSGNTWVLVNTGIPQNADILAFAIDPVTPATLYASTSYNSIGSDPGVFKSTDAGQTWTAATDGVTGTYRLTIDPVMPANVYVDSYLGAFKSGDGGANWSLLAPDLQQDVLIKHILVNPVTPSILCTH
ncbi:MAG: hypothetical protein GY862_19275 [Gammaproteobacteria bacterium]|nr:hypothetical protein [Gammaproteobacteria bacterium]